MKNKYILAATAIAALCLIAAGFILFSAEDGTGSSDTLKIGVFAYKGDDTFISNMMDSLRDIVDEHEKTTGIHLYMSILDAQGSQATQNEQIERYISLGYDVLCVNLVDRSSAIYVIDKAMEADIPVVFFNREPVSADLQKWNRVYYVGTDAALNGQLEGQIVVEAYNKDPAAFDKNGDGILQYIMIEGEFRHQDAVLRTEGSVNTITGAGIQVEKLDGGIADWVRSQAAALARDYFERYPGQIELIICNNDDMALGVLDIIQDLGVDFSNVVGIDGTPQGLQAIKEGRMLGTVVIDYESQARMIFDVANALLNKTNPADSVQMDSDRSVRAPMYVVTKK